MVVTLCLLFFSYLDVAVVSPGQRTDVAARDALVDCGVIGENFFLVWVWLPEGEYLFLECDEFG